MGTSAVARFVVWSGVVFVLPTSTLAQSLDQRPQVQVVRVDTGAIQVDGTLEHEFGHCHNDRFFLVQ